MPFYFQESEPKKKNKKKRRQAFIENIFPTENSNLLFALLSDKGEQFLTTLDLHVESFAFLIDF